MKFSIRGLRTVVSLCVVLAVIFYVLGNPYLMGISIGIGIACLDEIHANSKE